MDAGRVQARRAGLLSLILFACSRPASGVFQRAEIQPPAVPVVIHTRDTLTFPDAFRGKWVLVGWIYTHCPDVCPLTASRFMNLRDSLRARGISAQEVRLLLLSFDPERDSVSRLRAYAESFRADSMLLFGRLDPLPLQELARALNFSFKKLHRKTAGHEGHQGYAFAHDVKVFLVNPEGRVVGVHEGDLQEPLPVQSTLKEIVKLQGGSG